MATIKINGIERDIDLYVIPSKQIVKKYNYLFSKLKREFEQKNNRPLDFETDRVNVPDDFFYRSIYKLLVKKYPFPFTKPFRSVKHMVNNTTVEEAETMVNYIWFNVLYRGQKINIEDSSKAKTKKKD